MSEYAVLPLSDWQETLAEFRAETGGIKKLSCGDLKIAIGNLNNAIPDYWADHIDAKIETIKKWQNSGDDCFSFIVMTDMHYPSNLGKNSPKLARKIMDECGINHVMVLGDVQNRGQHTTKDAVITELENIKMMLSPVRDNLLNTRGNHDGSWGATLNGVTYPYNLTKEELYEYFYKDNHRLIGAVVDENSGGFYVDDAESKVRYIVLNTHNNKYELNADGSAKYNNHKLARFQQSQYDLVIEALNSMSDGWAVVVAGHVPISNAYSSAWGGDNSTGDHIIMRNLLKAYRNKTTYTGSWAGTNGYDAVSVNVDFRNAKGVIVGYFSGHIHNDFLYGHGAYGVDIITTRCDAAQENDATLKAERVAGTATEQCFDVFTVNKTTQVIYGTRIGAGSDRIVGYGNASVVTYSITNTLTNCKNSNSGSVIDAGTPYSATITANTGCTLESVTVTMDGVDITASAYANGVINIESVTGNIVITAVATVDIVNYSITNNLTDVTTNNAVTTITGGSAYTATLTPRDGYALDSVTVTMGGKNVTSSVYANGVINIPSVSGNIVITASAIIDTYTNLFDPNAEYDTVNNTRWWTNWMPFANSNMIYHIKGAKPYKFQIKAANGTTSAEIYTSNANTLKGTTASYDSSVYLIQHDMSGNATQYTGIRFMMNGMSRDSLVDSLIITANEQIIV